MRRWKKTFTSTERIIGEAAKKLSLADRLPAAKIMQCWHEIVGETVASRSCPLFLRRGRLVIRVSHPSWMQELSLLKAEIIARIAAVLPSQKITDIRLEAGELPAGYGKNQLVPVVSHRELTPDEKEFVDCSVSAIADEELRSIARRAMAKGFAVTRKG